MSMRTSMQPPSLPPSLTWPHTHTQELLPGDNANDFIGNGTYFYARADGEPHDTDQDEPSQLLSAAEKGNAVLTLFGPSGERGDDDEIFAEVRCLMANEVTEGSYDPDAQEEGAASSSMAAFAGWAFVSAAVAFQLV
jgi:hypothetical protein